MIFLKATIREELGRKSKKLRRDGYVPGVLYGRKVKSTPISIGYKEFEKVYNEAGESTLVTLELETIGTKDLPKENVVLIRDAVVHPLLRSFIHVDFYQVPMDEKISVSIPLVFENESPAVKSEGAVLVRNIYEIGVSAYPKDLPSEISVDLSALEHTDDSILVKSLAIPAGVDVDAEEDFVIASVSAPDEEEIIEDALEDVAAAEIQTEGEARRDEEAKDEEAKAEAGVEG